MAAMWKSVLADLDADIGALTSSAPRVADDPVRASRALTAVGESPGTKPVESQRPPSTSIFGTPRTNLSFFDARSVERLDPRWEPETELTKGGGGMVPPKAVGSSSTTPRVPTPRAAKAVGSERRRVLLDPDATVHIQGDVELATPETSVTFGPW